MLQKADLRGLGPQRVETTGFASVLEHDLSLIDKDKPIGGSRSL